MKRLFKLLIIKKKTLVFSIGLAALMLSANNLNAQNGGGLFGRGMTSDNAEYSNRDGVGLGSAENENPTAPLGSGIVVLTAIGAGYALLKRKEDKQ